MLDLLRQLTTSAMFAVMLLPPVKWHQDGSGEEPLSSLEKEALAQLDSSHAMSFRLVDSWYENRPIQYYDLGTAEPQPGSLYHVRGQTAGDIVSSIPGVRGYSTLRQVFDVEILPTAGVAPDSVRSHQVVLELVRRGQARLIATGVFV